MAPLHYLASSQRRGLLSYGSPTAPSEFSEDGCQTVTPQRLGPQASAVTHLPLAFCQPLKFTLLGLQDLLHLRAEGQAPGVALGSREVSAPALLLLSPSRAKPALPTLHLHLHPGLGSGVQDVLARPDLRTTSLVQAKMWQHSGGLESETWLSWSVGRQPTPSSLLLPHTGQCPAPLLSHQRSPGPGSDPAAGGGSPQPAAAAAPGGSAVPSPHRAAGPLDGGQSPAWKGWGWGGRVAGEHLGTLLLAGVIWAGVWGQSRCSPHSANGHPVTLRTVIPITVPDLYPLDIGHQDPTMLTPVTITKTFVPLAPVTWSPLPHHSVPTSRCLHPPPPKTDSPPGAVLCPRPPQGHQV